MSKRIDEAVKMFGIESKKTFRELKIHHKMLFAFLVFIGAVLLWYGVWTVISDIPIVNNPLVATGLGLIILIVTGTYYRNVL